MKLRHFFYRIIDQSSSTYSDVAEFINLGREAKTSAQVLTNKFNPNSDSHLPHIEECEAVLDMLGAWPALAELAAARCNRVVFSLPEADVSDVGLLDSWLVSDERRGVVSKKFRKAYEDGRISEKEFLEIEKSIHQEISAVLSFLANVERVKR